MKSIALSAALVVLAAAAAQAQDPRGEAGLNLGYTGSNGITSNDVAPSGSAVVFAEVRPKSAFSWGLDAGYFVNDRFQVGVLFAQQESTLQVTGPETWRNVGDGFNVQNYHATVAFHTGDLETKTRFYVLAGLGATRFGQVTVGGPDGLSTEIGGITKFSTTWGAGVKVHISPRIGARLGVRWTPANLGETADEWVCAYGVCAVDGTNTQYSHQVEIAAGVAYRF